VGETISDHFTDIRRREDPLGSWSLSILVLFGKIYAQITEEGTSPFQQLNSRILLVFSINCLFTWRSKYMCHWATWFETFSVEARTPIRADRRVKWLSKLRFHTDPLSLIRSKYATACRLFVPFLATDRGTRLINVLALNECFLLFYYRHLTRGHLLFSNFSYELWLSSFWIQIGWLSLTTKLSVQDIHVTRDVVTEIYGGVFRSGNLNFKQLIW